MLSTSTSTATIWRVTVTARPYHHGNLRAALLEQAERTLAEGGRRSVAARARARGRRQPRRAAPPLRRQAGAARRAGRGRLRAPRRPAARRDRPTAATSRPPARLRARLRPLRHRARRAARADVRRQAPPGRRRRPARGGAIAPSRPPLDADRPRVRRPARSSPATPSAWRWSRSRAARDRGARPTTGCSATRARRGRGRRGRAPRARPASALTRRRTAREETGSYAPRAVGIHRAHSPSGPCSSDGKKKMSPPERATVTCAMNTGRSRSYASAAASSRSVPAQRKPTPTWSHSPSPAGQPAAQQDRRRAVGAGRQHNRPGAQLAGRRREPDGAPALQQHAVDERVAEDRQVLPRAGGVEVGEGGVPAHGPDGVDRVQDRVAARHLGPRRVPGRELLAPDRPRPHLALGPAQVRLDRRVAPAVPPLVVVPRRAGQHHARVVRRAAAEDAGAQLRAVLAVGRPRVREGERAGVERVGRPAPILVRAVVGSGLDQANLPPVLAQARGKHTAGGASACDQHVEAGVRGHPPTLSAPALGGRQRTGGASGAPEPWMQGAARW